MSQKQKFLDLLRQVRRPGTEDLIAFLEESDFFTAPASSIYHGNYEGGLVEHSLKVYEILCHKVKHAIISIQPTDETLILIALLHDLCKTNVYQVAYRNEKTEFAGWVKVPYYKFNDEVPLGHGEKSVMMAMDFIRLTMEEKLCIRWHMGFSEASDWQTGNAISNAYKKCPLAFLLHQADWEAALFFNI